MSTRPARTRLLAGRRLRRAPRGTILIVVMLIIAALVGMVLVLGRAARVEAMASVNQVAEARAAAVEQAAEQYVLALLATQRDAALTLDPSYFEAVRVGDAGAYWIVRPDYGDSTLPAYGLVDEASKINLRSAPREMLHLLPTMPEELPDSIFDWKDEDSNIEGDGAESEYYLALPTPYNCKNENFETVEELLLVRGAYPELLFGDGVTGTRVATNGGGTSSIGGMSEQDLLARGLYNYLTVYSREPAEGGTGAARVGRINVNTAPREVLMCLPGVSSAQADALVSKRGTSGYGSADVAWANEILRGVPNLGNLITGASYQFSADIVAVSGDGRAFRRVRVVVDAFDTTARPKVVYRHDLTDRGWPMDPEVLASMRNGTWAATSMSPRSAPRRQG